MKDKLLFFLKIMGYALNMKHKTLVIPTLFSQLVGIENLE